MTTRLNMPLEASSDTRVLLAAGILRATDRVLEPGCFRGDDCVFLGIAGCRVFGFDPNRKAIDYARSLSSYMSVSRRVKFATWSVAAMRTRFRPRTYDVVLDRLLLSNLQYRKQQRAYVAEVARVLVPGGLFVIRFGISPDDLSDADQRELPDAKAMGITRWFRPLKVDLTPDADARRLGSARYLQMDVEPRRSGFTPDGLLCLLQRQ